MTNKINSKVKLINNYSTYQMDNFYDALANGLVKPSGIMNYIQHLYIAQLCLEGSSVLDVCCGRGLMIPILKRYAPKIHKYIGVDISQANLDEAREFNKRFIDCPDTFSCNFVEGDVTKLTSFVNEVFDVIIYTSAIEHLDYNAAITSLYEVFKVLSKKGTFFLSTPRTKIETPRKLQYSVHIYEWDREELENVLLKVGFEIIECIGLLSPQDEILLPEVKKRYGEIGVKWFAEMKQKVPQAFLNPVLASCFPEVAKELLYVCKKQ